MRAGLRIGEQEALAFKTALSWWRRTRATKHVGRALSIFAIVFLVPRITVAQTGEVHCPTPGTQLKYSDGGTIESLGEAGGFVCRFKNVGTGKNYGRILGAFDPSAPLIQANLGKIQSLIPLQVGKSVTYENSGASNVGTDGAWRYTLSIEKYEPVTTPAGTMPTFVILYVEKTIRGDGTWERRYWYSPLLGHIIKFDFKTIHGNPPRPYPANWELVEIRTP